MQAMIELTNICKTFNKDRSNQVMALKDVDLRVETGEIVAIMGPSGSGKSTLLHILAMLETSDSGKYLLGGKDTAGLKDRQKAALRNKNIGIVLQEYGLVGELSAQSNVEIPLIIAGEGLGSSKRKALEALKEVDLADKAQTRAGLLSGGERQRVAIARAIVTDAQLILADEPTGAVDTKNGLAIMELFLKLHKNGKTIVIVTHNPEIAAMCQRTVYVEDGRIKYENNA